MENIIKLYVPSSLGNLSIIRAMMRVYLEHQKVESKDSLKIISILDELATNAIEHGYGYEVGDVIIELKRNENTIQMIVEDNGIGFDEDKISKDEGGMGLFLVKSMSDSFNIEKKVNGTKIKVEKKIKKESES